jgi:hypothetical protein
LSFSRNQAALSGLAKLVLRHNSESPRSQRLDRIVIAGGPHSGKSTLAAGINADRRYRVHDGEELVGGDWSAGSLAASLWLDEPGPWICENVAMARAIRKWLTRNPTRPFPADLVINLSCQVAARSPGQAAMAKGCETVWAQVQPELVKRGVRVIETTPGVPITLEAS